MQSANDILFPYSAFPVNEDAGLTLGSFLDGLDHLQHGTSRAVNNPVKNGGCTAHDTPRGRCCPRLQGTGFCRVSSPVVRLDWAGVKFLTHDVDSSRIR